MSGSPSLSHTSPTNVSSPSYSLFPIRQSLADSVLARQRSPSISNVKPVDDKVRSAIKLLDPLLESNKEKRERAQVEVEEQLSAYPLLISCCLDIAVFEYAPRIERSRRQIALVSLKNHFRDSWDEIAADTKKSIRQQLSSCLLESSSFDPSIRSLLFVLASEIIVKGNLTSWKELGDAICAALSSSSGSFEQKKDAIDLVWSCLEDKKEKIAADLVSLLPVLLSYLQSDPSEEDLKLRKKVVDIYALLISSLIESSSSEAEILLEEAVAPHVSQWVESMTRLSMSGDLGVVVATLRAVSLLIKSEFSSQVEPSLITVLDPVCTLLVKQGPAFENLCVNGEEGGCDLDEKEGSLPVLVMEFCDLLANVASCRHLKPLLSGKVGRLLELLALPYLLVSEASLQQWASDPEEFLQEEDADLTSTQSIRSHFEKLVVVELLASHGQETREALVALSVGGIESATQKREGGKPYWWKVAELALYLLGLMGADLDRIGKSLLRKRSKGSEDGEGGWQKGPHFEVAQSAIQIVSNAIQAVKLEGSSVHWLLLARAYSLLSKTAQFTYLADPSQAMEVVGRASEGLRFDSQKSLVLEISACKAFTRFLPLCCATEEGRQMAGKLIGHKGGVLTSLCALMGLAGGADSFHVCVEVLLRCTRCCQRAVVRRRLLFIEMLKSVWAKSLKDPILHLSILDLVRAGCRGGCSEIRGLIFLELGPRVREAFSRALSPDSGSESYELGNAIEIFGVLLQKSPHNEPFPPELFDSVGPFLLVLQATPDPSLLQSSADALLLLVKRNPVQLRDANLTPLFLSALLRFLDPEMDEIACVFVSPLMSFMLLEYASEVGEQVLPPLLRKLRKGESPVVAEKILEVFCKMLTKKQEMSLNMLARVSGGEEGGGFESGLDLFLQKLVLNFETLQDENKRMALELLKEFVDEKREFLKGSFGGKTEIIDDVLDLFVGLLPSSSGVHLSLLPSPQEKEGSPVLPAPLSSPAGSVPPPFQSIRKESETEIAGSLSPSSGLSDLEFLYDASSSASSDLSPHFGRGSPRGGRKSGGKRRGRGEGGSLFFPDEKPVVSLAFSSLRRWVEGHPWVQGERKESLREALEGWRGGEEGEGGAEGGESQMG